jgi:hypothetical protein
MRLYDLTAEVAEVFAKGRRGKTHLPFLRENLSVLCG